MDVVFQEKNALCEELYTISEELSLGYSRINKVLSENLIPLSRESYHFFSRLLVPRSKEEKLLFNLIFAAMFKVEKLSGGSSNLSFLFCNEFFRALRRADAYLPRSNQVLQNEWKEIKGIFKEIIEDLNEPIDVHQLRTFVKGMLPNNKALSTAVYEALQMSGLEGSIFVEDGKADKYIVEAKDGYVFPLKVYPFFLQNSLETPIYNARVVLIDGVIETVGEVDQLLLRSQQDNCPLVIFAQGFHEEILATLHQNLVAGKLQVFPVKIPVEVEAINVVNDVAYACKSDVVSCLNGQRVSMTKWESLPIIPKILLTENQTTIWNPEARSLVSMRLKDLVEQRARSIPELQEFIDRRIKSLSSSSVILRIPNVDRVKSETMKTEIDICLRAVKSLLSYGTTSLSEALEKFRAVEHPSSLKRVLESTLEAMEANLTEPRAVPLLGLYLAIDLGASQMLQVQSSSGFLKRV